MFFVILDFLILPGSHLTSVSTQKLRFLLASLLMMPNLGPWPLWYSPLMPPTFWVEIEIAEGMGCSRWGGRGGRNLTNCFLLLRFGFHELCADKEMEGWGKGRMGMEVRVMNGRVYVEGDNGWVPRCGGVQWRYGENVHVSVITLIIVYICTYLQLCTTGPDYADPPTSAATAPVMRFVATGQRDPLTTQLFGSFS
jgi:hypothetical protein